MNMVEKSLHDYSIALELGAYLKSNRVASRAARAVFAPRTMYDAEMVGETDAFIVADVFSWLCSKVVLGVLLST